MTPTVNKKATARNEITTTLNNKLQEIQATPDATDEEKQDEKLKLILKMLKQIKLSGAQNKR